MRLLYVLLAYLLAPVFCAVLLWRGFRERGYWSHFSERFGFGNVSSERSIWVHAVSMGEVQAAAALIRSLREKYPEIPIVVTTVTATGRERVQALFGEKVQVRYLPLDLPGTVQRFFERVKPRIAIIFETELWPNLYHECGRRRVPLILASARISPRSVSRYRRMAGLFKETLAQGIIIAAQGEGDAERFRSIGANPKQTHVTGNIKFDLTLPPDVAAQGLALRERYVPTRPSPACGGGPGRRHPVWIAGSTHAGEEQVILDAHRRVRQTHPDALLILVPRHPNRFTEVADWLTREGANYVRRSQEASSNAVTEILLVDTLGELLLFYAASDVAFVGGSLVPIGGHNLLEPAALGLPVLTGPHNFNGADVAKLLIERGAAAVVHDANELSEKVSALLADSGARARIGTLGRASIEGSRGALGNLLSLIEPLLGP